MPSTSDLHLPALDAIRESIRRDRLRSDPVAWVRDVLGEFLWSKQREILLAVRDHRRVAVRSAHSVGKSFLAARLVAWWIECHPIGDAFAVTSASTGPQVRAVLWREIARAHTHGKLRGRLNQTEWMMPTDSGEEMVAFGRKPSHLNPTAFQGIHAPKVLVVLDEAGGIPKPLWDAADSLISNENSRMIAIGNPDDPLGEFAEVSKPGSGWHPISISAFETPNFTGEKCPRLVREQLVSRVWVEEKRRKWGENSPMYEARVLGQFPKVATDGLIPIDWVLRAQARWGERDRVPPNPETPIELGVDVGGGGDRSTIAERRGHRVKIVLRDRNPNTMQTYGNVLGQMKETGATRVKIDKVGIGRGMCDLAIEQGRKDVVLGINVGESATDPDSFVNLRAEGFWSLRSRFQEDVIDIDPADEDLAAQLIDLRYKRTSAGKIQIESKEDMKRRGRQSPDDADAVMLAFLEPPPGERVYTSATWGREIGR